MFTPSNIFRVNAYICSISYIHTLHKCIALHGPGHLEESQKYTGTRTLHQNPRRSHEPTQAPGHEAEAFLLPSCIIQMTNHILQQVESQCLSECRKTCKQVDIRQSYNAQPKSLKMQEINSGAFSYDSSGLRHVASASTSALPSPRPSHEGLRHHLQ